MRENMNVGGRKKRVKRCCDLYLQALGEECVHVIRTASHAEAEGRGDAVERGREVGRERCRGGGGERLNCRDRERKCVRLCASLVALRRKNDDAVTTAPFPRSAEYL